MVYYRNWIILAAVVFILIAFISSAQAGVPLKDGNPGLPGCLAKVDQLEQTIADQQATIGNLQEQINTLQASLDAMKNYVPVAQTGQKYYERPGDDADLRKGVEWPVPRFTDNNDGTVTDSLTRLVWLKNADCFGAWDWYEALIRCNNLQTESCGLTDNSSIGDWRLPNRNELLSLHDINYESACYPNYEWHGRLPHGHPFINVLGGRYWTSSTSSYNFAATAWSINMDGDGTLSQDGKSNTPNRVWPVRDPK